MLATHITEVVKIHGDELLSREETNHLLAQLKEKSPKLVEELGREAHDADFWAESGVMTNRIGI